MGSAAIEWKLRIYGNFIVDKGSWSFEERLLTDLVRLRLELNLLLVWNDAKSVKLESACCPKVDMIEATGHVRTSQTSLLASTGHRGDDPIVFVMDESVGLKTFVIVIRDVSSSERR